MTKNRLVTLIFIVMVNSAFGQKELSVKNYVILTFEERFKISQHNNKVFYWIIEYDSIQSSDNNLSHLFLNNFSKNILDDCCNGKGIDPFIVTQNTSYNFDSTYFISIRKLKELLTKAKKKVLTVNKKWASGQEVEILIFAVPVSGIFCYSDFHELGQKRYGYTGRVFVPVSSFTYFDDFWKSKKAAYLLNQDFSKTHYDIIPY